MSDWNKHQIAGLVTPPRNNYFYGKLLDESHLRMEQSYFNQKRWMMNRLGLGSGVLCGLQAVVQGDHICFSKGVVIDGKGREIVVSEALLVDPKKITDDMGVPTGEVIGEGGAYVCLAYRECPAEPVPVLVTDCDSTNLHAPSVIRESFRVIVKKGSPPPLPEVPDPKLCNALRETDAEAKHREICEVLRSRTCSENDSQACVVLAGVTWLEDKITLAPCEARPLVYSNPELFEMLLCLADGASGGTPGPRGEIGPQGETGPRGETGPQGVPGKGLDDDLTHIIEKGINWEHDGEMTANDFFNKGLGITFSSPVTATSRLKSSANGWFIVSAEVWGGKLKRIALLEYLVRPVPSQIPGLIWWVMNGFSLGSPGSMPVLRVPGEIKLESSNTLASFKPEGMPYDFPRIPNVPALYYSPQFYTTLFWLNQFIEDLHITIRVTLKTEFLTGKNGKAVDGNHIGGKLPSGDGVQGGDFESWFQLTQIAEMKSPKNIAPSPVMAGAAVKARKNRTAKGADAEPDMEALANLLPSLAELEKFFKKGG